MELSGKNLQIPRTLTIAGSDSGGGAGIQADLKTFSALQTYGMSAITAITAQNTCDVTNIFELSSEIIHDQIRAVTIDIGVDAFKTGMLASTRIIEQVARSIQDLHLKNYVLDPVMVAKSGANLLAPNSIQALIEILIPMADVITPNRPEAELITGIPLHNEASIRQAAEKIALMGAKCVLIKGGHAEGDPVDWVYFKDHFFALPEKRIPTKNTHGSGCTYSAAITAFLAQGYNADQAIRTAKNYVHQGIIMSLHIGQGHGPLHHFHPWYSF